MNKIDLNGRCAVVTGGAQGFGRAITERFVASGAKVAIWDHDLAFAERTAKEIGPAVSAFKVDVSDLAAVEKTCGETLKALGKIDILVNNAGIGQHKSIEEITVEDFDRMFNIHVKGSFFCGQAVIPAMKERRSGKIINISSIWGQVGADTASHYCAAKTALLGLTKAWAKELAPWNIHVNAVCPGGVITEMPIKVQGWEKIRMKEKKVPLGRWAQPEEISHAVAFYASAQSDFITGQALSLNGGETIVGI
jgi:3-oxoacyl-[acyl-carrier protein] reductase